MRKSRLDLPDEFRARERWRERGVWCYRLSLTFSITLLIIAAVTEGVPILPEPYFSLAKRWMSTAVALAMILALGGFIFSRE